MILTQEKLNSIKYFFSLAFVDIHDEEKLLEMAGVTEQEVSDFLEDRGVLIILNKN